MVPQRPIVICHPVWRLALGGLERQLAHVVKGLPADRFVHVLVVRGWEGERWIDPADFPSNVRFISDGMLGKDRLWAFRLAAILREHGADILHVRGFSMLLDSLLAGSLLRKVSVAFSFHGFEEAEHPFGRLRKRLYRAAVLRCDDRWAVSRTSADNVASRLGLPAARFDVMPNGVDACYYQPAVAPGVIRRRLDLPEDRLLILSVGNFKPVKGHAVLLEAFRRLGREADRTTLLLAGRDYLAGELRRWADQNLPGRDIRFVGEQTDVLPWYQAADLFVLPSRWEGLSNALLEAMSCALPSIATAVGGNREVIDHGSSGLLVPPDDPASLASALRLLLGDADARRAMGRAGRRSILAGYSIEQSLERYAHRYQALAGVGQTASVAARPAASAAANQGVRSQEGRVPCSP